MHACHACLKDLVPTAKHSLESDLVLSMSCVGASLPQAAAAARTPAHPRPSPAARAHTGAKKPPPGKRLMRPWPEHVPFTYRDTMRIRFLLNGAYH